MMMVPCMQGFRDFSLFMGHMSSASKATIKQNPSYFLQVGRSAMPLRSNQAGRRLTAGWPVRAACDCACRPFSWA